MLPCRSGAHKDHPTRLGAGEQRIEDTDQPPIGRHIDGHHIIPILGCDVAERRDRAQNGAIAEENIKLAEAFVNCGAQPVDAVHILQIGGNQRCAIRGDAADFIIKFFQGTLGPGERDDMRALFGEFDRRSTANAARCTGDEGDPSFKLTRHD